MWNGGSKQIEQTVVCIWKGQKRSKKQTFIITCRYGEIMGDRIWYGEWNFFILPKLF